jgi:hypothetical protein
MDRRHFITKSASAVMTTSLARELKLFPKDAISAEPINAVPIQAGSERKAVSRHRIGVNYTPSNVAYPVGCQSGGPMLNFRHGPPWFSDDAPRISAGIPR